MAKAKNEFYAVRKGKEIGIFKTWDECKVLVVGFKGAEYKGFPTEEEAIAYMGNAEVEVEGQEELSGLELELLKTKELSSQEDTLVVYIDGSYGSKIPDSPYTYGMAVINNNQVIHEDKGFGEDPEAKKMNNVAGELLGAMKGTLHIVKNHPDIKKIFLFHDYQGIGAWFKGDWKTKNDMTRKYVEFMKKIESSYGVSIGFVKVAGHKGNPFNELVDELAKEALEPFKVK